MTTATPSSPQNVRMFASKTLLSLGRFYKPLEALAQVTDNFWDADATDGWVVFDPDCITFTDNGHGMRRLMLPGPKKKVEQIFSFQDGGKLPEGFNLREALPPDGSPSGCSLEYAVTCVSLSIKREGGDSLGYRGQGLWAFLTNCNDQRITSQPNEVIGGKNAKASTLVLPTYQQIDQKHDVGYTYEDAPQGVRDPWGKQLPHGTTVVQRGFFSTTGQVTLPSYVLHKLRTRYAKRLADPKFKLWIVDRASEEAKKQPKGELVHRVRPIVYRGTKVLDRKVEFSPGVYFQIVLWYDANGKEFTPMIMYKGGEKEPLTSRSVFHKRDLWTSGKLWGEVEFPVLPNEGALWDSSRDSLLYTGPSEVWEAKIQALEPELKAAIKKESQSHRTSNFDRLARDATTVATLTFQQLEMLRDEKPPEIVNGEAGGEEEPDDNTPGATSQGAQTKKVYTNVQFRVRDEEGLAVPSVWLRVLQGDTQLNRLRTTGSGVADFGEDLPRNVELRGEIEIPAGKALFRKKPYFTFTLTDEHPGRHFVFYLDLGKPKKAKPDDGQSNRSPGFKVDFVNLDDEDPDVPCQVQLEKGRILIHSNHRVLRAAIASGNNPEIAGCIANCIGYAYTFALETPDLAFRMHYRAAQIATHELLSLSGKWSF